MEFLRKRKRVFLERFQRKKLNYVFDLIVIVVIFLDLFQMTDVENCSYNLTSPSDTFSSNNDDSMYSSFIDCRWAIHAESSSQVRLTFVYFDTEKDYDIVTVNLQPYSTIRMYLLD